MKIVIVGAGRMGFQLAEQLDKEGHRVFLIDHDRERIEAAKARLDVMAVVGSGSRLRTYRELDVGDAHLLVAATDSDEVNFVACLLARHLGIQRRIARVQSTQLVHDLREVDASVLGVDEVINAVEVTVNRLLQLVLTPNTTESAEFAGGKIVLRALRVTEDSPLIGIPMEQLHNRFRKNFLIAAVQRERELIVPKGDFELQNGDIFHVVMRPENLERFLEVFQFPKQRNRKVMVFGATATGRELCRRLERRVRDVLLIDPSYTACERAGRDLSRTSVIHGSALDKALMHDLKVDDVDCFLAVTGNDEANLSSTLLANRLGVGNVIMLTGEPEYVDLFSTLPIRSVVSPMLLSVGAVLALLRHGRVISLFKLAGGRVEAVEVEAQEGGRAVGRPLRDIRFPSGMMVAAVTGGDGIRVAVGSTVVHPGDRAIVVAQHNTVNAAVRMFSAARKESLAET